MSPPPPPPPSLPDDALVARFATLAAEWEAHLEETRASSRAEDYVEHPAFDAIVALGPPAIPLILARYSRAALFWGAALRRITGRTEFGDGLGGDLKATRLRWLSWGAAQGLCPQDSG